jgi:hypothetical protein
VRRVQWRTSSGERVKTIASLATLSLVVGISVGAGGVARTQGRGSDVKAPFRILDDQGRALVEVSRGPDGGSLTVLSTARGVVTLAGEKSGGAIRVSNSNSQLVCTLVSTPNGAAIVVGDARDDLLAAFGADISGRGG